MLKLVGLGGTFDRLHMGHELLLKTALSVSEKIVIGLAADQLLVNKKHADKIQNYNARKQKLIEFIAKIADLERVSIVKLTDPYGPPIKDPEYEGIVVSQETYEGAVKINEKREEMGFSPLIIIVIPVLRNEKDEKISSSLIREKST